MVNKMPLLVKRLIYDNKSVTTDSFEPVAEHDHDTSDIHELTEELEALKNKILDEEDVLYLQEDW